MIVVNYHKRPEGQESEIYQIRRSYAQISRNQSPFTLVIKKINNNNKKIIFHNTISIGYSATTVIVRLSDVFSGA